MLAAKLIPTPSLTLLCRRELPLHDRNRFANTRIIVHIDQTLPDDPILNIDGICLYRYTICLI